MGGSDADAVSASEDEPVEGVEAIECVAEQRGVLGGDDPDEREGKGGGALGSEQLGEFLGLFGGSRDEHTPAGERPAVGLRNPVHWNTE